MSVLAAFAVLIGAIGVVIAAVAYALRVVTERRDDGWLREQRARAYLELLAATHAVAQPERDLSLDDHRAAWLAVDAVEVLGPVDVGRAARDLYEAAAEIMRYAVSKAMGELDSDKVVAMADAYATQRRLFVEQARAAVGRL